MLCDYTHRSYSELLDNYHELKHGTSRDFLFHIFFISYIGILYSF